MTSTAQDRTGLPLDAPGTCCPPAAGAVLDTAAAERLAGVLKAVISQRLVPRIGGGRVAAYEILLGTQAVSNLIREGKVRQLRNIISTSQRDGMCVLEQSLAALVQQGVVTLEEAMAASIHPEDITGLHGHAMAAHAG